ncbi:MAG: carboxypeptidase-like regulatory domain-containing protein, partial [Acidobacteria bacterium]|nr:carboxypeptidase-like regulatory domain-containing protein [Acidobacteriota bacterium]
MGRSRLSPVHPYLLAALMAIIAGNSPAPAGGPLLLSQSGKPFLWPSGGTAIPFNPDQGKLGPLVNAAAVLQTVTAFSQWESIPTATATYVNAGKLPVDVNITNFAPFLFPSAPDGLSAIVYDADGSIFGLLFGGGSGVLGFAGPEWVNPATGTILEGVSFLNGGSILGGFPSSRFLDVQVHEFGHYSNLAHTVVNGQVAILGDSNGPSPFNTFPPESLFGKIETMYPFIIGGGGMATPHADDRAIFSTLYPRTGFFAEAGSISGTILSVSGEAKLSGINVIARNIADPFVDAVSAISGDFQLIPGGSGSFAGAYRLNGLTPGAEYAVFIDRIRAGGFSTPPLNFASPEEFYNGAGESGDPCTDFPGEFVPVVAAAGVEETGIDIILNPFPLDFDFDGVVNQCDNCLDTPNPLQLDDDTDGRGNLCDNCAFLPNPLQEDFDTDGTGDLCDSCTDGDGDGFGDPGFPINQCEVDNCPEIGNPLQLEEDGDGFGNLCDNCPAAANFPQVDGDGNGVGDACQPIVAIVGIQQEDGVTVRVETLILHPQGNQLMGTAAVLIPPDPVPL